MIASLSLILLCQLAGEVFVRGLGLPMPGPVVGLLLLLMLLLARDHFTVLARGPLQQAGVENASRGLLAHLSLLFAKDQEVAVTVDGVPPPKPTSAAGTPNAMPS